MAKGIIKGKRLTIHVGDHQHQLNHYQLTVNLADDVPVITIGIDGTTYSGISVNLATYLDKRDTKRLLRFLENRLAKM